MERLISLFREADYESWSPSDPQPPPAQDQQEPLYFKQLLEYLRREREEQASAQPEDVQLIGA
jgi:hypothetical protein